MARAPSHDSSSASADTAVRGSSIDSTGQHHVDQRDDQQRQARAGHQRTPDRPGRRRREPIIKDGLLDLVLDEVIGEGKVPDPDPEHWQDQLKQVARDQRAGGLPPHLAVQGYLLLIATANGFTIDETGVDDSADSGQGSMLRGSDELQEVATWPATTSPPFPPATSPT